MKEVSFIYKSFSILSDKIGEIEVYKDRMKSVERNIHSYQKALYDNTATIYLLKKVLKCIRRMKIPENLEYGRPVISQETRGRVDTIELESVRYDKFVRSEKEVLNKYTRILLELEEQVKKIEEGSDGSGSISIESIRDLLRLNTNVIPESCKLLEGEGALSCSEKSFEFILSGLRCTPNRNIYFNIPRTSFPLRDIRVEIDLVRETVRCYSASTNQKYDWMSSRVHPHIMAKNEPCFGDYISVIHTAISDLDWQSIVGIMQSFLEQANDTDTAGAYWPRHLLSMILSEKPIVFFKDRMTAFKMLDLRTADIRLYALDLGNYKYKVPYNITDTTCDWFDGNTKAIIENIEMLTTEKKRDMLPSKYRKSLAVKIAVEDIPDEFRLDLREYTAALPPNITFTPDLMREHIPQTILADRQAVQDRINEDPLAVLVVLDVVHNE